MKKITKIVCAMAVVAMASCSSDSSSSGDNCTSDIPFLQTGKTLNYKLSQFGYDAGTLRFTVGDCAGSGFLVSRQAYDVNGTAAAPVTDLWKQEGDFLLTDSNNNGDYFAKVYKKNATLGQTWSVTRPDGSIVTNEVVDIDSLVTVPAGSFHCIVYKYSTTSTINDSYVFWKDDVGNVMEDSGFFLLELMSYN